MKIKDGVIIQQMQDDFILIDSGIEKPAFSGMIRLNKTSKEIVEMLQKEDLNEEDIVNKLLEKYDAPRDVVEKGVSDFIKEISKTVILIK